MNQPESLYCRPTGAQDETVRGKCITTYDASLAAVRESRRVSAAWRHGSAEDTHSPMSWILSVRSFMPAAKRSLSAWHITLQRGVPLCFAPAMRARTCDEVPRGAPVLLGVAVVDVDVFIAYILSHRMRRRRPDRVGRGLTARPRETMSCAAWRTTVSLMSHCRDEC